MTIEQKAQRYDEALKRAKKLYEQGTITESLSYVFPELKESEDERIRKELLDFFNGFYNNKMPKAVDVSPWIDWLEKQVQKSDNNCLLSWSEEDERFLNVARNILNSSKIYTKSPDKYEDTINWLNSLKDRVQPKQEWSEEDNIWLNNLICHFETGLSIEHERVASWLKSLKERYAWKPSEEQLDALERIVSERQSIALESLYEDIRKLKV